MRLIFKKDFLKNQKAVFEGIISGAIFIYPTDTIYGLGCNALNSKSVKKIREIKKRETKPFSVIVPSKQWILENCEINDINVLDKLPGPYTLIFKLKNKRAVASLVNPQNQTIGVRIPDHWFTKIIQDAGVPFVTTSVNIAGQPYMTKLEDMDEEIRKKVDFIIYEGEKRGRPSKIIDLTLQ